MNDLSNVVTAFTGFAGTYIVGLESILSTFWNLPLFAGITLGPLILFFIIVGFIFGLFKSFVR